MLDDTALLRDYAENRSDRAFAELVRRHVNLVYSAALRRTGGDVHRAKDVVQHVFNELARKPGPVARHPALAGWLHAATRNAAINAARAERRRHHYEQEAALMMKHTADETAAEAWGRIGPLLDEAVDGLSPADRDAVVLRFFDRRPFAEIGQVLRVSEDGARMRVQRALEKLRRALEQRGLNSTSAALAATLAAQTTVAAPAGLATTVAGTALAGAAIATSAGSFAATWAGLTGVKIVAVAVGIVALFAAVTMRSSRDAGASDEHAAQTPVASRSPGLNPAAVPAQPMRSKEAEAWRSGPGLRASPGASEPLQRVGDATQVAAPRTNRAKIEREYDKLLTELRLPAEEREKVVSLLVDLRESGADFAAASAKTGVDVTENPQQFNRSVKTLRERIKGEMKALIGEDGYRRYLAAEEDLKAESYAMMLERSLRKTPTPLNPEQARELTRIIQQRAFDPKSERLMEEASRFLSPPQLEALQGVQEIKRNGVKSEKVREAIRGSLAAPTKT